MASPGKKTAVAVPEVALRSGNARPMPAVGMGTAAFPVVPETTWDAVLAAAEVGYRHFDTAALYMTEELLGEAMAEAAQRGVIASREAAFITSKLWSTQCHPHLVLPSLRESLQKLKMEYVDLYLLHWPISLKPAPPAFPMRREDVVPFDFAGVWQAMVPEAGARQGDRRQQLHHRAPGQAPRRCHHHPCREPGGDEPGVAAADAEGVLRGEGHSRGGVLAAGRAELVRRRQRSDGVGGARGDSQGQGKDRRTGVTEMDLRARSDPCSQELQQRQAYRKPWDLRLGVDRRRPVQDQPNPTEEDCHSCRYVLA